MVIISGTVPFFTRYYDLDVGGTGLAVGCINIGAALGALIAGKLSSTLGRRKTLILCAALFAITGIATGWATDFPMFITARIMSGVAVGVAALVCPIYIAEIAPSSMRGKLVTLYQLAIVSGLLLAYLSNYALLDVGENNWRWMFSPQTIPSPSPSWSLHARAGSATSPCCATWPSDAPPYGRSYDPSYDVSSLTTPLASRPRCIQQRRLHATCHR